MILCPTAFSSSCCFSWANMEMTWQHPRIWKSVGADCVLHILIKNMSCVVYDPSIWCLDSSIQKILEHRDICCHITWENEGVRSPQEGQGTISQPNFLVTWALGKAGSWWMGLGIIAISADTVCPALPLLQPFPSPPFRSHCRSFQCDFTQLLMSCSP